MTSAPRLRPNSVRKIHRDQKPRRLARKFWRRRRVSGLRCRRTGTRDTRLRPPAGEIDTRVDGDVGEVANEGQKQSDDRVDVERAEHDRIVAIDRRLEAKEPEPVE